MMFNLINFFYPFEMSYVIWIKFSFRLKEFLPKEYVKTQKIEKRIFQVS